MLLKTNLIDFHVDSLKDMIKLKSDTLSKVSQSLNILEAIFT